MRLVRRESAAANAVNVPNKGAQKLETRLLEEPQPPSPAATPGARAVHFSSSGEAKPNFNVNIFA